MQTSKENLNVTIKAEQMRVIAERNPTAHGLLLLLALNTSTNSLEIPYIMRELKDRGIEVVEDKLYDALSELEELNLGSIVYAKKGEGNDTFMRNYNLNKYVKRAFTPQYLTEWETKFDQENEQVKNLKTKLVDPSVKFQPTVEPVTPKKNKRYKRKGRPKGYSHALGRFFTAEELAAREERKKNPPPRGRPVGWRKYPENLGQFAQRMGSSPGKRGRPPGYSPKLGRPFTAKELAERNKKNPRGRPVGWRKDPEQVVTKATPSVMKNSPSRSISPAMQMSSKNSRVLSIPLRNNRQIRIEIPPKLSKDEVALMHLNLEHLVKSS